LITITGKHIRAARALLGWTQLELSKKARTALGTILRMEGFDGPVGARTDTLGRVVAVLEIFRHQAGDFFGITMVDGVYESFGDSSCHDFNYTGARGSSPRRHVQRPPRQRTKEQLTMSSTMC
jgi:transcriptional regulator with XRE-family HTH domain